MWLRYQRNHNPVAFGLLRWPEREPVSDNAEKRQGYPVVTKND